RRISKIFSAFWRRSTRSLGNGACRATCTWHQDRQSEAPGEVIAYLPAGVRTGPNGRTGLVASASPGMRSERPGIRRHADERESTRRKSRSRNSGRDFPLVLLPPTVPGHTLRLVHTQRAGHEQHQHPEARVDELALETAEVIAPGTPRGLCQGGD